MPSTTPGPDQGNMVNKNGALKMHGSKHPLKMYDKGSAAKMNSEFKYTPIQTDATGKRAGDSPMNMYGKSSAKMAKSAVKMAETDPKKSSKINKEQFNTDLINNKTQSYFNNNPNLSTRDAELVSNVISGKKQESDLPVNLKKGLQAAKIDGMKTTLKKYPKVLRSSNKVKKKGKSPAQSNKSPLEANTNPSGKNKSRQTYSATLTTKPKPEVKAKKEKTNSGPTQQASSVQAMKNAIINSGMKPRQAKKIQAMKSMLDVKDAADEAGVSSNLRDYMNYKSK